MQTEPRVPKENLFTPDCIRTHSGRYLNVFDPNPDDILIEDIAHALSFQPRFGGHLPKFYSVAQHSVLCAEIAAPPDQFASLMHDASEAYLCDIPRPIKQHMPEYKKIEDKLQSIIAAKFGFEYPHSAEVHRVDNLLLQIEWETLMLSVVSELGAIITPWDSDFASRIFMSKFILLNPKA